MFDAPCPYPCGFRPLLSGGLRHLRPPVCASNHPMRLWHLSTLHVQAFILNTELLCLLLTFVRPSPYLSAQGSPLWQTGGSPRVLRTHFHPIYPSHLLPRLLDDYRVLNLVAFSPRRGCVIYASCSSARTLLTASSRPDLTVIALAVRLTVPVIRVPLLVLPPPSECALTGIPQKDRDIYLAFCANNFLSTHA